MKTYRYYLLILLALLGLGGCKDFLDPDPRDRYSDIIFWENEEATNLYFNRFYPYISSYGNFGESQFGNGLLTEGLTDMLKYGTVGTVNKVVFNPFFVTADQSQGLVIWSSSYERIRRVNEFLVNLKKFSKYDESVNLRFEAQARFMRGFLYYQLLLRTKTVILFDGLPTSKDTPLSSESACWDFVEQDLNFAIDHLPVLWDAANSGRITKGAALAMKSRAMLVAKRWDKARIAALEVLKLENNGELLYELNKSYTDAFKSYFKGNKESIMEFNYSTAHPNHTFDKEFAPGGDWENHGGTACPTQEMVEEYELATGGKPDWSSWHGKTNETPPYALLEPRFHASVLYNGASWKKRKIESYVGGKDGYVDYGFSTLTNGKTTTGYYLRKYLDESIIELSTTNSSQPWIEIRLAEVYLNLAEACAMLGAYDQEANNALREVRKRVNLPHQDQIGDNLMQAIRHERKVELAFEGFYYWDLRRWNIAHEVLDKVRFHGLKITKSGDTYTYEYVDCDKEDRKFAQKFYNFPILPSEIANNTAISQIELW